MPVYPPTSQISVGNSSTTPVLAGQTFTGTGELSMLPDVMISCYTDQPGVLYFDFSTDGTNWDSVFPVNGFDVAAGIHEFHTAVKGPRYFRVRLYNSSASDQTILRLSTYYGPFRPSNAPLTQTIATDTDAVIVRAIDTSLDLAFGSFSGMSEGNKFGYTADVGSSITLTDTGTWEDVWTYGGKRTSPTSSFTPYMASSDSADTDISVTWTYLDADGIEQTVTVNTDASDGQTPVSLGVTATEVYRGRISDSAAIAGAIGVATTNSFTAGVPTNQNEVLANINPNDRQTQVLAGRVPANKQRRVKYIHLSMLRDSGLAGSVIASFDTRLTGEDWISKRLILITNADPKSRYVSGLILPPSTDFRIRIRDVSSNGTYIEGSIDFDDLQV